jgi:hypothetical protein
MKTILRKIALWTLGLREEPITTCNNKGEAVNGVMIVVR